MSLIDGERPGSSTITLILSLVFWGLARLSIARRFERIVGKSSKEYENSGFRSTGRR